MGFPPSAYHVKLLPTLHNVPSSKGYIGVNHIKRCLHLGCLGLREGGHFPLLEN